MLAIVVSFIVGSMFGWTICAIITAGERADMKLTIANLLQQLQNRESDDEKM